MREFKIWSATLIIVTGMIYLPASFAIWDLNAANWPEGVRAICALAWVFFIPAVGRFPGWRWS